MDFFSLSIPHLHSLIALSLQSYHAYYPRPTSFICIGFVLCFFFGFTVSTTVILLVLVSVSGFWFVANRKNEAFDHYPSSWVWCGVSWYDRSFQKLETVCRTDGRTDGRLCSKSVCPKCVWSDEDPVPFTLVRASSDIGGGKGKLMCLIWRVVWCVVWCTHD